MVRVGNWVLSDNRVAVIAGVALLLAVAGIFMISRLTQASPAGSTSNNSQVMKTSGSLNTQTSQTTVNDDSSAPAEEFLNESPGQASSQTSNNTKVTVNGQNIPIPENGSVNQTINNNGSTTTVNVDNRSSSSGTVGSSTNRSSSSVNVRVQSTQKGSL